MMTTGPTARLLQSFGAAKPTQVLAAGRPLRDRIRMRRAAIPAPSPRAQFSVGVVAIIERKFPIDADSARFTLSFSSCPVRRREVAKTVPNFLKTLLRF